MATDLSRVPAEVRERIRELEEELKEGGPVAAGVVVVVGTRWTGASSPTDSSTGGWRRASRAWLCTGRAYKGIIHASCTD